MTPEGRIDIKEVPYDQCDASQRVAWDWLWKRLLGSGDTEKPAQTPATDQAGQKLSRKAKRRK
jgi:hypothetical protein